MNAGRPRAIAQDITFAEKGPSPAGDRALIAAMRRARPRLVLASPFTFTVSDGEVRPGALLGRDRFFEDNRIRFGWPGLPNDPAKVIRRIYYEVTPETGADPGKPLPTLAAQTARLAGVDPDRLPDGARRRALGGQPRRTTWIDYHGEPGTFRAVSARDVLSGRVPSDAFRDKVVIIGVVAGAGVTDVHRTSVEEDPRMSGLEVHANAISTMLQRAPLRDTPRIVDVLLIAALALLPLLA